MLQKLWISNIKKHSQAHFQGCYQTPENKIVFQKILSEKLIIFQKILIPKQTEQKSNNISCTKWEKNHYSHLYSNVWYLSIFVIYLNSNMFIKKKIQNYFFQNKPTTSCKTTHSYLVFKCLILICIFYLFEFKYFNYVLGFFPLFSSFCLKFRTLSPSHF